MTITATIIADSISPQGIRLTTFQLRYPRFIHAEFMTHRMFSRNASSSRAVPFEKLREDIERDPAMPVHWGVNQKGMQAKEELYGVDQEDAIVVWTEAMRSALIYAGWLNSLGLHKQIVNRVLEPYSHINVVCTATDYANFYALRRHPDAQPEIKALADAMWEAQQASKPMILAPDEWHLPYITETDWDDAEWETYLRAASCIEILTKVSVARCARVSYLTHDGKQSTFAEDLALYEKLVGSTPLHASPAEHQATPDEPFQRMEYDPCPWLRPQEHGNLTGWRQLRKMLPHEFVAG